ncbi:unnamed protein product [Ilex paraguariensis]|uniref:Thiamine pyrophosphate enzyme TPP-binding domain-containing protein n=1 Tax=Ilex paraguariensis TaxID=185542 RepID=A0ABC8RWJ2_9AQUA
MAMDVNFVLVDVCKEEIVLRKPSPGLVEDVKRVVEMINKEINVNFMTPMRIIRDAILGFGSPAPILVSEGLNTMDVCRGCVTELRSRLDDGTWGTGLGYCIAAAVASPRLLVAVEGDSGFGFTAMELEVYSLTKYLSFT